MDLLTSFLCLFFVILSGAVLLFMSLYGMKEKTYEEALAEQRKLPDKVLLLKKPEKEKNRSKKGKRQRKKIKEKLLNNKLINGKEPCSLPMLNAAAGDEKKSEQDQIKFVIHPSQKLNINMHNNLAVEKKKEKVKPTSVNKKEQKENGVALKEKSQKKDVIVNQIAKMVPGSDLQLKPINLKNKGNLKSPMHIKQQYNSKEKFVGTQSQIVESDKKIKKEKNLKSVPAETTIKHKSEKVKDEKMNKMRADREKEEKLITNSKIKGENHVAQNQQKNQSNRNSNISVAALEKLPPHLKKEPNHYINYQHQYQLNNKNVKNKKHGNNDITSLQQMVEKDTVCINLLISLIRKAELSRSEVQILTNMLLTKHLDEVSNHFEWIEGRQDPVVKLKKQLAEKEKALSEEQDASRAFQTKLKELRSEYNSERVRLTQACRQLEETVLAKQGEIQSLHATNRHLMDSHMAEKQALTQKIQQLQAQIKDENLMIRKIQEDHGQTQNALQQELVTQRQQMEMHIGRLSDQLQEAQKNFEVQIHSKIQEAEQIRVSLNAELQKNRRHEEELRDLKEQQIASQNKIKSLESRTSQLKESSNHAQELLRQIEDLQRSNKDWEMRYNNSHQLEEEYNFEKSKLQNEIHSLRNKVLEWQNECEVLLKNREQIQVAKLDLENDLLRIKEENQCLISQLSSKTKIEREVQLLREENQYLTARIAAFGEPPASENGTLSTNEGLAEEKEENVNVAFINGESEGQKDVCLEKLAKDLERKEILLEQLRVKVSECESEVKRRTAEAAQSEAETKKLTLELESQRNKNNDLRKKNWKAMEALAETEKMLELKQREAEISLHERQKATINFLERIFPSIKVSGKVHEDWFDEFEKKAKELMDSSGSAASGSRHSDSARLEDLQMKNDQLQASVVYYKTIIEDTESMLKKLQNHIEHEEIRWRQQCEALEVQVQVLKDKLAETATLSEKEECALNATLASHPERNEETKRKVQSLRETGQFGQDAFSNERTAKLESEDEFKLPKGATVLDGALNSSGDFVAFEKLSLPDSTIIG